VSNNATQGCILVTAGSYFRLPPESESYVTTDGQSASLLGIKHPSGTYDHIFITVRQLRFCWRGAASLTTGCVRCLQLLLAPASAVIFVSKSSGTRDHILLSQISDFLFVTSYDSQGHGGGIRLRLHAESTSRPSSLYSLGTDMIENISSNGSSIVAYLFVIGDTCLKLRWLAMAAFIRSIVQAFGRNLLSNLLSSPFGKLDASLEKVSRSYPKLGASETLCAGLSV
jgi:hypothetical protein